MNIEKIKDKVKALESQYYDSDMSAALAGEKLEYINSWLHDHPRIVKLTALIPVSNAASGEFAYITPGKYRKIFNRNPSPNIMDKSGRRIKWEYALDEFTQELGYDKRYGSSASEELRNDIVKAQEFKQLRRKLENRVKEAKKESKKSEHKFTRETSNLQQHEMVQAVQDVRSIQAKAADSAQTSTRVVHFPNVDPWLNHPERVDIPGIDTRKKRIPFKHAHKNNNPGIKSIR